MRGTFALNNSVSAHTIITAFVAYRLSAIAFNKHLRLLLPKDYVPIVAYMRMLQRAFILHITMRLQCSATTDFLLLSRFGVSLASRVVAPHLR
jgi:hypothetical protein